MNKKCIQDGVIFQEFAGGLRVLGFVDKNDTRHKLFIPEFILRTTATGELKKLFVTEIAKHAFFESQHIQSVEFPKTVTVIGHYAFKGCKNLKEVECKTTGWFNGGLGIQRCAFQDCKKLQKVRLNRPVSWIANDVFNGCLHLERFDADCKEIHKGAFENCNLKRLVFTSNASIHGGSIEASGVQELVFYDNVRYATQGVWKWIKAAGITVYCPENSRLAELAYDGVNVELTPARTK